MWNSFSIGYSESALRRKKAIICFFEVQDTSAPSIDSSLGEKNLQYVKKDEYVCKAAKRLGRHMVLAPLSQYIKILLRKK